VLQRMFVLFTLLTRSRDLWQEINGLSQTSALSYILVCLSAHAHDTGRTHLSSVSCRQLQTPSRHIYGSAEG